MKIKGFIVILLFVILCFLVYLLVSFKRENSSLRNDYYEKQEIIKQNEIDKENYFNREKELQELKEKNRDKVLKYEEVEEWNQEIKGYLY